jgi:hypothetical protein
MGFSTETANEPTNPTDYVFYVETPKDEVPNKLVEQPEECYICHGDGPLFYFCVCKNYGRCKACTLDAYKSDPSGCKRCIICNEKYVYETEIKEVFNYSECIKDFGILCGACSFAILVLLFWAFMFVGFSYDESFRETYVAYNVEPIYDILILSYISSGFFHVITIIVVLAAFISRDELNFKPIAIVYSAMLFTHQFIGVVAIWIVTGKFIFNIVSMCIGTFFAIGVYILVVFCWCCSGCRKFTAEGIKKSYTERQQTIKFPTSI